ncbi:MAG TPA: ABC transporter ATP-binding protein [Actinomycetota bacterium]|nr:ABC transporter ATP-binding protein [Actinomycetota bacterium]
MAPILEVRGMGIRFGGLVALDGVDLDVPEWEIVGLIGPNGAGKTTLFDCIMGVYRPDAGTVAYRGGDVSLLPTHRRVRLGIGRTFQNIGLVKELTVVENVMLAQHARAGYGALGAMLGSPPSFAEERRLRATALEVLDFVGLGDVAGARPAGLPYGTLKLVEIATVLATDPQLILLDEPTSGMGPEEAHALGERLLELRKTLNVTILMIEHHVPLVVSVCDYVYVLNFGRILTKGRPSEVQRHPDVLTAYLGGSVDGDGSGGPGAGPDDDTVVEEERDGAA